MSNEYPQNILNCSQLMQPLAYLPRGKERNILLP